MEDSTDAKTTDTQDQSVWKQFKSIFPYLSVFIIILGLIYQGLYYWHFNIEIENYIGVSELLLAATSTAVYTIFGVCSLGLLFFATGNKDKDRNEKWWISYKHNLILLFVIIIMGLFIHFRGTDDLLVTLIPFIIIFIYPIITNYSIERFNWFKRLGLTHNILLVPLLIVLTISFVICWSEQDVHNVEKGEYIGTKIYTEDSTYVSDSKHFYIGKTTNFYFIFNKDKASATILPEREVRKFFLVDSVLKTW